MVDAWRPHCLRLLEGVIAAFLTRTIYAYSLRRLEAHRPRLTCEQLLPCECCAKRTSCRTPPQCTILEAFPLSREQINSHEFLQVASWPSPKPGGKLVAIAWTGCDDYCPGGKLMDYSGSVGGLTAFSSHIGSVTSTTTVFALTHSAASYGIMLKARVQLLLQSTILFLWTYTL